MNRTLLMTARALRSKLNLTWSILYALLLVSATVLLTNTLFQLRSIKIKAKVMGNSSGSSSGLSVKDLIDSEISANEVRNTLSFECTDGITNALNPFPIKGRYLFQVILSLLHENKTDLCRTYWAGPQS